MAIHSEKSRKKPSYFDAPLKSTVQSMKRAFERSNTFLGIGQGSFYLSNWNLIPNRKVNFWHCIFCAQDNTQYVLILFNCSLFHKLFIALIKLKFFSLKKGNFWVIISHSQVFQFLKPMMFKLAVGLSKRYSRGHWTHFQLIYWVCIISGATYWKLCHLVRVIFARLMLIEL